MRKTRLSLPEQLARRVRGVVNYYFDTKRNVVVARKWPKKAKPPTPAQIANRERFGSVARAVSRATYREQEMAKKLSVGTDYLWRDLLMSAAYGNLVIAQMNDGTTWIGGSAALSYLQQLLNSLTTIAGALIVNTTNGWLALVGGTSGQLLTIDPVTGLPNWITLVPPSIDDGELLANISGASAPPVGTEIEALLDYAFGNPAPTGALLWRSTTGWVALAPGAADEVLTIDATTGYPTWEAGGGGGGSAYLTDPMLAFFSPTTSGGYSNNNASQGNIVTPNQSITIYAATIYLDTVSGATYQIGIAPYDTATNKITAAPTYAPSTTTTAATTEGSVTGIFSGGYAMTEGDSYIVFIARTDASGATAMKTYYATAASVGPAVTLTGNTFYSVAQTAPGTGNAWTSEGDIMGMALSYTV